MFGLFKSKAPKKQAAAAQDSANVTVAALEATMEAYKLARRDRPREHNQPDSYSGDAAVMGSHELMHRRTRDLARNTAQAKRIAGAFVNLVVGTGMQTFSWPFLPHEQFEIATELDLIDSGELGPRLAHAIESDDLFDEWANDPKQFDIEGRLSWPQVQRMLLQESVIVGTGLLVRCFRAEYDQVPLCYQLMEREQLDDSKDRPRSEGINKIVGGLEMDKNNRVVAYHFLLDHPDDIVGTEVRESRIVADRVIDLSLFHRPSASVAVSWLDACGQTIWDRDSYMDSEIRSAALDAVFAFVAKLEDSSQHSAIGFADGEDDTDEHGNREFKVGHSPVAAVIGENESLEMVRSTRPNPNAASFIGLLDRDTASSTGLSYYSLTGDYANTNFSSSRAAKLDEDLMIKPLQNWFAILVAIRVRKDFNEVAAACGLFTTVTPAEFKKNKRTYQRFDAVGAGRDLLDPFKEGEARTGRLRTGMSTFKEECARIGKHWIRVLMQLAIEDRISNKFGIHRDYSKAGNGPQKEKPISEPTEDEKAEQIADRVATLLDTES